MNFKFKCVEGLSTPAKQTVFLCPGQAGGTASQGKKKAEKAHKLRRGREDGSSRIEQTS